MCMYERILLDVQFYEIDNFVLFLFFETFVIYSVCTLCTAHVQLYMLEIVSFYYKNVSCNNLIHVFIVYFLCELCVSMYGISLASLIVHKIGIVCVQNLLLWPHFGGRFSSFVKKLSSWGTPFSTGKLSTFNETRKPVSWFFYHTIHDNHLSRLLWKTFEIE